MTRLMTLAAIDGRPVGTAAGAMHLRVDQVRWEAQDVVSILLTQPDGAELPAWRPGAHVDVVLPSGLIRQYSLCGDPSDRHAYTVAVLREESGRGGSVELHDTALVGRVLEIRGPRNHFELLPAPRYLFLAGGIGVTPILAMVREVAGGSAPWALHYGGRTRSTMAFRDELAALGGDRVHLVAQDERGILDLPGILAATPPDTDVYCCGPEPMLRAAEEACLRAGQRLRLERFTASADRVDPVADGSSTGFVVELRRSGVTLEVPPDRTLLDVVRDEVWDVPYSCEEGHCGACETRVLAGTPEHHDEILTAEQRAVGDRMMICVGRCRTGPLVLDL